MSIVQSFALRVGLYFALRRLFQTKHLAARVHVDLAYVFPRCVHYSRPSEPSRSGLGIGLRVQCVGIGLKGFRLYKCMRSKMEVLST